MNPTAEEHERDRAEAIRLAWACLEADGIDISAFLLGGVTFVTGHETVAFDGREVWLVWFKDREPDPHWQPSGAGVYVDAVTKEARRIGLL